MEVNREYLLHILSKMEQDKELAIHYVDSNEDWNDYAGFLQSRNVPEEAIPPSVNKLGGRAFRPSADDNRYHIFVANKARDAQTTAFHELGHILDYKLNGGGQKTQMGRESKAWEYARILDPNIKEKTADTYLDAYREVNKQDVHNPKRLSQLKKEVSLYRDAAHHYESITLNQDKIDKKTGYASNLTLADIESGKLKERQTNFMNNALASYGSYLLEKGELTSDVQTIIDRQIGNHSSKHTNLYRRLLAEAAKPKEESKPNNEQPSSKSNPSFKTEGEYEERIRRLTNADKRKRPVSDNVIKKIPYVRKKELLNGKKLETSNIRELTNKQVRDLALYHREKATSPVQGPRMKHEMSRDNHMKIAVDAEQELIRRDDIKKKKERDTYDAKEREKLQEKRELLDKMSQERNEQLAKDNQERLETYGNGYEKEAKKEKPTSDEKPPTDPREYKKWKQERYRQEERENIKERVRQSIRKPVSQLTEDELRDEYVYFKSLNDADATQVKRLSDVTQESEARRTREKEKEIEEIENARKIEEEKKQAESERLTSEHIENAETKEDIEDKKKTTRTKIQQDLEDVLVNVRHDLLKNRSRKKTTQHPEKRYQRQMVWADEAGENKKVLYTKDEQLSQSFLDGQKKYLENLLGVTYGRERGKAKTVRYDGNIIFSDRDEFIQKASILDSQFAYLTPKELVGEEAYNRGVAAIGEEAMNTLIERESKKDGYRKAWLAQQLFDTGIIEDRSVVEKIFADAGMDHVLVSPNKALAKAHRESYDLKPANYSKIAKEKGKATVTGEDLKEDYNRQVQKGHRKMYRDRKKLVVHNTSSAPNVRYNRKDGKKLQTWGTLNPTGYDRWLESTHESNFAIRPSSKGEQRKRMDMLNYVASSNNLSFHESEILSPNSTEKEASDIANYVETKNGISIPRTHSTMLQANGIEAYQKAERIIPISRFKDMESLESFLDDELYKVNEKLMNEFVPAHEGDYFVGTDEHGYRLTYTADGEQVLAKMPSTTDRYHIPVSSDPIRVGVNQKGMLEKQITIPKGQEGSYVLTEVGKNRMDEIRNEQKVVQDERTLLSKLRGHILRDGESLEQIVTLDDDLKDYLGFSSNEVTYQDLTKKAMDARSYAKKELVDRAYSSEGIVIQDKKTRLENAKESANNVVGALVRETGLDDSILRSSKSPYSSNSYAKEIDNELSLLYRQMNEVDAERRDFKSGQTDYGNEPTNMTQQEAISYLRKMGLTEEPEPVDESNWFDYSQKKTFLKADVEDNMRYTLVTDSLGNRKWMLLPDDSVLEGLSVHRDVLPEARPADTYRAIFDAVLNQNKIRTGKMVEKDGKEEFLQEGVLDDYRVKIADEKGNEIEYRIREYDPTYMEKALSGGENVTKQQKDYVRQLNLAENMMKNGQYYQTPGDKVPFQPEHFGVDEIGKTQGVMYGKRKHILTSDISNVSVSTKDARSYVDRINDYEGYVRDKIYNEAEQYIEDRQLDIMNRAKQGGKIEILLTPELQEKMGMKVKVYDNAQEAAKELWNLMGAPSWDSNYEGTGMTKFGASKMDHTYIPNAVMKTVSRHASHVSSSLEHTPTALGSLSYTAFANALMKNPTIDLTKVVEGKEAELDKVAKDNYPELMMKAMHGSFLGELLSMDREVTENVGASRYKHILKEASDRLVNEHPHLSSLSYKDLSGHVYDIIQGTGAGHVLGQKYSHMEGLKDLSPSDMRKVLGELDERSEAPLSLDRIFNAQESIQEALHDVYGDTTSVDNTHAKLEGLGEHGVTIDNMSKQDVAIHQLLANGGHGTEGTDSIAAGIYQKDLDTLYAKSLLNRLKEKGAISKEAHQQLIKEWDEGIRTSILTGDDRGIDYNIAYNVFDEFIHGKVDEDATTGTGKHFGGHGHDVFYRIVDPSFGREMVMKSFKANKAMENIQSPTYEQLHNLGSMKNIFPNMKIQGQTKTGRVFDIELGEGDEVLGRFHDTGGYELIASRHNQAHTSMPIHQLDFGRVTNLQDKKPMERKTHFTPVTEGKLPIVHIPEVNYNNLTKVGPKHYMEHSPAETFIGLQEVKNGAKAVMTDFETLMLPDQVKDKASQAWVMESTMQNLAYNPDTGKLEQQGDVIHHIVRPSEQNEAYVEGLLNKSYSPEDVEDKRWKRAQNLTEKGRYNVYQSDKGDYAFWDRDGLPSLANSIDVENAGNHYRIHFQNSETGREHTEYVDTLDNVKSLLGFPQEEQTRMFSDPQRVGQEVKTLFNQNEELSALRNLAKYGDNAETYGWGDYKKNEQLVQQIQDKNMSVDDLVHELKQDARSALERFKTGSKESWREHLGLGDDVDLRVVSPEQWVGQMEKALVNDDTWVMGQNIVGAEQRMLNQQREGNYDRVTPELERIEAKDGAYRFIDAHEPNRAKALHGLYRSRLGGLVEQADELGLDSADILNDGVLRDIQEELGALRAEGDETAIRAFKDTQDVLKRFGRNKDAITYGFGTVDPKEAQRIQKKYREIAKSKSPEAPVGSYEGYVREQANKEILQLQEERNGRAEGVRKRFLAGLKDSPTKEFGYEDLIMNQFAKRTIGTNAPTTIEGMGQAFDDAVADVRGMMDSITSRHPNQRAEQRKKLHPELKNWIDMHELGDIINVEDAERLLIENRPKGEQEQEVVDRLRDSLNLSMEPAHEAVQKHQKTVENNPKDFNAIEMMHLSKHLYPEMQERGVGFSMESLAENIMKDRDQEGYDLYNSGAHTSYVDTLAETKAMNVMLDDLGDNAPKVEFYKPGDKIIRHGLRGDVGEKGLYTIKGYEDPEDLPDYTRLILENDDTGEIVNVSDVSEEGLRRKVARNFMPLPKDMTPEQYYENLAWDDAREDISSAQQNLHSMRAQRSFIDTLKHQLGDKEFTAENLLSLADDSGHVINEGYRQALDDYRDIEANFPFESPSQEKAYIDGLNDYQRQLLANKDYFSDESIADNLHIKMTPRRARAFEKSQPFFDSNQAKIIEKGLEQIQDLRTAGLADKSDAYNLTQMMNDAVKQKAIEKNRVRQQKVQDMVSAPLDNRFGNMEGNHIRFRTNSVQQITQGLESPLQRMIESDVGARVREQLQQEGIAPTEDNMKSRIINQELIPFLQEQEMLKEPLSNIDFKSGLENPKIKLDHLAQSIYNHQFDDDGNQVRTYESMIDDNTVPYTEPISSSLTQDSAEEREFAKDLNDTRASIINQFIDDKAGKSTLPGFTGRGETTTEKPVHSAFQFENYGRIQEQRKKLKSEHGFEALPNMKIHPLATGDSASDILNVKEGDVSSGNFFHDKYQSLSADDLSIMRNAIGQMFDADDKNRFTGKEDAMNALQDIEKSLSMSDAVNEQMQRMIGDVYDKANNRMKIRENMQQESQDLWRETYERLMNRTPDITSDGRAISNVQDIIDYHSGQRNSEPLNYLEQLNWMDSEGKAMPVQEQIFPRGYEAGKRMKHTNFSPSSKKFFQKQPVLANMIDEWQTTRGRRENPLKDTIDASNIDYEPIHLSDTDDLDGVLSSPSSTGSDETPPIDVDGGESYKEPPSDFEADSDSIPEDDGMPREDRLNKAREAIERGLQQTKDVLSNRWVKLGGLGVAGALLLHNAVSQPAVLVPNQSEEERQPHQMNRPPLESRQNDSIAMNGGNSYASQSGFMGSRESGQGTKSHPQGYDVKISGQSNGKVDQAQMSQNFDKFIRASGQNAGNIQINTSDNSQRIDRQWLERQVDDLLNNGYAGGM